jgi:hypothetical protein
VSLDYPYYEELCRRNHPAAWWWLIGDRLYYLGLLPAMVALPFAGIGLVAWLLGLGERYLVIAVLAAVAFPVGAVVCFIGSWLKRHAYRLAERDGISPAEVFNGGAASRVPEAEPDTRADGGRDPGFP